MNRPNIILIDSDQQRGDFSAAMGYPLDITPTADRLGREGVRFPYAYCPEPICLPARTSLLTGRFTGAHGLRGNVSGLGARFTKDLTDVLQEARYRSVLVGKDHTYLNCSAQARRGGAAGDDPNISRSVAGSHGYDEWFDTMQVPFGAVDADEFYRFKEYRRHHRNDQYDAEPMPFDKHVMVENCFGTAINWLKSPLKQGPFFMHIACEPPHQPYIAPEPYHSMFPADQLPERNVGPEAIADRTWAWQWAYENQCRLREEGGQTPDVNWRELRQVYLGMTRMVDDQVARIIQTLKETGLAENTIVCVSSDHGDFVGDYGLSRKGLGLAECLTRIPMVWWGAGVNPHPDAAKAHVSWIDILPTICEIVGVDIPRGVQGRSLWPILNGSDYCAEEFCSMYMEAGIGGGTYGPTDDIPADHDNLYCRTDLGPRVTDCSTIFASGHWDAVVLDHWKIVLNELHQFEMYNLDTDFAEKHNLAEDPAHADVFARLQRELFYWLRRGKDELPHDYVLPKQFTHNWQRDPSKGYIIGDFDELVRRRAADIIHR